MEIKAKCKLDMDTTKALTHLWMFKKANPKKRMLTWLIVSVILVLVLVLEAIVFSDITMMKPIWLLVVIWLLECFLYFIFPKMQYKSLSKMKNAENQYTFCDNILKTFTKSDDYTGQAEIEYSLFEKVYETSKYFFMYQTKNQVFVVDKSTIEGGTVEEIRNKLSAFVKDKYILCKY